MAQSKDYKASEQGYSKATVKRMAQSNGDEELSSKLWAILDDYRNLEMPARYGNIDWAEHAIQQLWVADRKQHELEARLDEAERFLHYDLFGTMQRIERTNDAINRRIGELKAERSKYGTK